MDFLLLQMFMEMRVYLHWLFDLFMNRIGVYYIIRVSFDRFGTSFPPSTNVKNIVDLEVLME